MRLRRPRRHRRLSCCALAALAASTAPGAAPVAWAAADPGSPPTSSLPRTRQEDSRPWRWPVSGAARVTARFEAPPHRYAAGHRGLDLATGAGTTVLAVEAGVVAHAGPVAGRGTVTVAHTGGLSSTYEPVRPLVGAGDEVTAGQPIGVIAPAGGHCATGGCLHLGARRGRAYLDPADLLPVLRVVLLPWQ